MGAERRFAHVIHTQTVELAIANVKIHCTAQVQRVNMSKRLGLPELSDSTPALERIFEAACPAKGTPVQNSIICRQVDIRKDLDTAGHLILQAFSALLADAAVTVADEGVCAVLSLRAGHVADAIAQREISQQVREALQGKVAAFAMPERTLVLSSTILRDDDGCVNTSWLRDQLALRGTADEEADEVCHCTIRMHLFLQYAGCVYVADAREERCADFREGYLLALHNVLACFCAGCAPSPPRVRRDPWG